jgi:hypothetical protein
LVVNHAAELGNALLLLLVTIPVGHARHGEGVRPFVLFETP